MGKNSEIKGERTRGAIVRAIPKQSDSEWDRVRVGVKRPIPEPSNFGGSGSNIGQGSDNLERRGRIRIKSSFRGIYRKGQSTTRSPRNEDDVPQRPLKRDRIRNLRIRRPSTSNINSTETTSTTSNIEKPIKTTSFSHDHTSEKIINLKGMVKEYKEIIRSTIGPTTVTTNRITTVKTTNQKVKNSTTSTSTTSTTTTTTTTTSTTTTTHHEQIPNIDSAENTITTLSSSGLDSSTKSLKQSIQSTTSSTTASLTVTESKESSGSDIKQSKAHIQKPSLFQL